MPRTMNDIFDYVSRMDSYGITLRSEPVPVSVEELATIHEQYLSSRFATWPVKDGLIPLLVLGHPIEVI